LLGKKVEGPCHRFVTNAVQNDIQTVAGFLNTGYTRTKS